jgi:multisubunit Na+/H+ antiporter MnhF subunit
MEALVSLAQRNTGYDVSIVVFVVGLGYVVYTLIFGRRNPRFRDRLIVSSAIVATALVMLILIGPVQGGELFSDSASSVSNAPGP